MVAFVCFVFYSSVTTVSMLVPANCYLLYQYTKRSMVHTAVCSVSRGIFLRVNTLFVTYLY